ncbi:MAG: hypothetical protein DMG22_02305 [Acidobacteria bacterium]|nr:MAG: hypothetical protein DMG22_02305 [Acidobacteriota bacterium]
MVRAVVFDGMDMLLIFSHTPRELCDVCCAPARGKNTLVLDRKPETKPLVELIRPPSEPDLRIVIGQECLAISTFIWSAEQL